MSLIDSMGDWVNRRLGREPPMSREESLRLRPVRNSAVRWERAKGEDDDDTDADADGLVTIVVPRREGKLTAALAKMLQAPLEKKIELDAFGSAIWERCDGAHTVGELAAYTSTEYKLNRRQAEVSVVAFMKMLSQRRLIGFMREGKGSPDVKPNSRQRTAKRKRRF